MIKRIPINKSTISVSWRRICWGSIYPILRTSIRIQKSIFSNSLFLGFHVSLLLGVLHKWNISMLPSSELIWALVFVKNSLLSQSTSAFVTSGRGEVDLRARKLVAKSRKRACSCRVANWKHIPPVLTAIVAWPALNLGLDFWRRLTLPYRCSGRS